MIGQEYCTDDVSSANFTYQDENARDNDPYPCKGGTVYCEINGLSWEVPIFLEGTPVVDYTAQPIALPPATSGGPARCKYPVHCIFPPGYLDGFSTLMPVVVENPEGFIVEGSGNCVSSTTPPNDGTCPPGGIEIQDPAGIGKDCAIHWICSNDPSVILETISYDNLIKICECYSAPSCATVKICTVNPTDGNACKAFEILYNIPCDPNDGTIVACEGARPAKERDSGLENAEMTNIKVYPNPFTGNINIDFNDAGYFTSGSVIITVDNILG